MGRTSLRERANRNSARDVIKQRSAAIDQMNSKLKRKFAQIDKSFNDLRADNIRYYYQIGEKCADIKANPSAYVGRDGTPGMKLMEQALSTQSRTLRKAVAFATTYSREELDELVGLTHSESNFKLNWGHVSYLLILHTPEQRQYFAMEAVEKMMDPNQLHAAIKKFNGSAGGHGRAHEMPATISGQVGQMQKLTKQWVDKHETVWDGEDQSVMDNVLNAPADELDEVIIEQLYQTKDGLVAMADKANAAVDRIERVIEHAEAQLAKQKEADAEAAAASRRAATGSKGRSNRAIDLKGNGTKAA